MSRLARLGRVALAAAAAMGLTAAATGQVGETPDASAPPLRLDVAALLNADALFPQQAVGPVWRIEPGEGRRLVVVPVVLPVTGQIVTYDGNALRLRGGRLLAWRIPEAAADGELDRPGAGRAPTGDEPSAQPPRITRAIEVHPDGSVHWRLDRVLPGAQVVNSPNPYTLLLDRQRLANMAPDRAAAPTRNAGESAADYQRRRMEAMNAQRDAMAAYRELQTRVRELPEAFSELLPPGGEIRAQAVFDLRAATTVLELQGAEPLPWEIGIEDLRAAGNLLNARQSDGGQAEAVVLDLLDRWPGAYTERLAAEILRTLLAAQTGPLDDALQQTALALMSGSDVEARRSTIAAVVDRGLSQQATAVIDLAADDADAAVRLHALRGQVRAAVDDPQALEAKLPRINALLTDASAPEAGAEAVRILAGVIDAPGLNAQQVDTVLRILGQGLAFAQVPAEHLQPLITAVVDLAPRNRLAAYWLDHQLLGSDDQVTARQTLATIAALPLPPLRETAAASPPGAESGAPMPPGRGSAESAGPPRLRLDDVGHHLLVHLAAVDQATRALAWEAALRFEIAGPTNATDAAAVTPLYLAAARAATAVEPILPQAVLFLLRQPHAEGRLAALMVVIGHADGPAAAQTAAMLLQQASGQGRLLASALASLEPAERDAFAAGMYGVLAGRPSAVTGLLRLPAPSGAAAGGERAGGNVTQWLAEQLAAGKLPPPGAWVEALGGEQRLLTQATGQEPAVLSAAAAALIASAGGDQQAEAALAEEFLALPEPTPQALEQAWTQAKRRMLLGRFQDVGGRYRVLLATSGEPITEPPAMTDTEGVETLIAALGGSVMDLGEIRLRADGQQVAAAGHALRIDVGDTDGSRTLVLEQPRELSGLGAANLSAMPAESLPPLRLVERRAGFWWTAFTTAGGQHGQMVMVRVGD